MFYLIVYREQLEGLINYTAVHYMNLTVKNASGRGL